MLTRDELITLQYEFRRLEERGLRIDAFAMPTKGDTYVYGFRPAELDGRRVGGPQYDDLSEKAMRLVKRVSLAVEADDDPVNAFLRLLFTKQRHRVTRDPEYPKTLVLTDFLTAVDLLIDQILGMESTPRAAAPNETLNENEAYVLRALAATPGAAVKQSGVIARLEADEGVELSRRTVSECLQRLRDNGLVCRPRGSQRKGDCITQKGLAAIQRK